MKVFSGIYTAPANLPVSLANFKGFIRQFASFEDTMLTRLLGAAVREAEEYLQASLEKQSRVVYINGTPERLIELDWGPVKSITSVKYTVPATGVLTVVPAEDYLLSTDGILYPVSDKSWPGSSSLVLGGFQIIYVAGYGDQTVSPKVELDKNLETGIFLIAQGILEKRQDCKEAGFNMIHPFRKGQGV